MKITCPKCHSTYRIDLPGPGGAGIDVQCGKCLNIFLFSPDIEKPDPPGRQGGTSVKSWNSDLPEDHSTEPILPPQKDEDQELSGSEKQPLQSKKRAPSSLDKGQETLEELELKPISDGPEPIEIIVEDETPQDSLEEEALDDIWSQAIQEGTRTADKSKEKFSAPPIIKPRVAESVDEETLEETPLPPSLPPAEKSKPRPSLEDEQPEKTQEEIDLEEQVTIDKEEALPSWEEAFAHPSEVKAGWEKAQEQDRVQEEQQLAEALGNKVLPREPSTEETDTTDSQEDKQSLADEIFAEAKGSQESPKETTKTPQPVPESDQKQTEVDRIFAEAKAQPEKTQEEIDLEKQVTIGEEEALPSWEEAFTHQDEVEDEWRKAQAMDRIQEKQQLTDALGEEYVPSEPTAKETPSTATQESKQDLVDQLSAEARSQQETAEQPEAKTQDKPLEVSGDKAESDEKEKTPFAQPISGDIDSTADLADLDMKQLIEQAFQEESRSEEKTGTAEPELELEPMEKPAAIPESAAEVDSSEFPLERESEPIPELTLDSAEETPEMEPELELESILETVETPAAAEVSPSEFPLETEAEPIPELTLDSAEETPEMESEPELTMESSKTTVPSQADSSKSQESLLNEDGEKLWTDLFPEHNEEEQPVDEEAPIASAQEPEEEPFGENDFWDQVLEKDSQESQTAETEAEQQPVSPAPVAQDTAPMAQDTAEREALTDEDLWKQAFPEKEELEPTTSQSSGEEEEDSQSKVAPLVIGASVNLNEESEDTPEFDEAAYADYDDDDEFEFQRRKRKLGPFAIPHGRRGDLVIGGAMVVFLLLAGSVYFTLQTFAPDELTDIQTAKTEVPEGLTPREVPLDELAGDLTSPKPSEPGKTPPVDTPGDKGEAILSDPSKILEESPEEKGILKDLAESQILKDTGKTQTAKIDQSALQALTGHSVTLTTIMPVAYNPTDIRVLSFSVEMQLNDAQSAKRVRESLPVYEEIMNQTVEDFLRRKFYNDILYVKEKLQKRLQTAMNQSLKNGRVKKTKFTDFAIQ